MAEIEDLINKLPTDCIKLIFGFLESSQDRCSCSSVCKKWLELLIEFITSKRRSTTHDPDPDLTLPLYRHLEGRSANDITLAILAVSSYPHHILTSLYLWPLLSSHSDHIGITDDGLKIIAQVSPGLTSLTLRDCLSVGNEGLKSVAELCRQLKKLELVNSLVDDDGIMPIAERCLDLNTLHLEHCPCISNEALMAFANKSTHLERIKLIDCLLIGDSGIFSLISSQPELMRIKLVSMKVGDAILETIKQHMNTIEVFYIEKASCPGDNIYSCVEATKKMESPIPSPFDIASLANLSKVELKRHGSLSDEILVQLSKTTQSVKKFRLRKCQGFTFVGLMEAVTNWSQHLEVLLLKKCIIVGKQETKQEQVYQHFPALRTLKLITCEGIDDGFLSWLGPMCKKVKSVHLVDLESITDRGLQAVLRYSTSHQLEWLNLGGCTGIGDLGFCSMLRSSGAQLGFLNLEGCTSLSDQSMKAVAERCVNLKSLDASCCRITDVGVLYLAMGCGRRLVMLSLCRCTGITEKSLRIIKLRCSGVRFLEVLECPQLSSEALNLLNSYFQTWLRIG